MVKLLENTFRAVNIGLVNEIALMCRRMDIERLGGDRGGQDQTVRLHALLSRTGTRRSLHSRSIRSISRGRLARLDSNAGSSSSRGRSTRRCPTTSSNAWATR
jgi:hypothetical protein